MACASSCAMPFKAACSARAAALFPMHTLPHYTLAVYARRHDNCDEHRHHGFEAAVAASAIGSITPYGVLGSFAAPIFDFGFNTGPAFAGNRLSGTRVGLTGKTMDSSFNHKAHFYICTNIQLFFQ